MKNVRKCLVGQIEIQIPLKLISFSYIAIVNNDTFPDEHLQ